jgi:hypothetical protein
MSSGVHNPETFKLDPWLRKPTQGFTTGPSITSVTQNSGRTGGGDSVVIAGTNFRRGPDNSFPTVFFGSTQATVTATAADGTSITCTSPAATGAGYVDVTVTLYSNETVTVTSGFLYYTGEILSVSPAYATTAGAVQVTVKGVSLASGAAFTFGGTLATNVIFIDDTQYVMTVPAHVAGFVDVTMEEAGGHESTIKTGFQFTTLARGSDVRRFPGMSIQKTLGSQPWTARFCLDGNTNKPVAGEEIQITDAFDSGRVLFHGMIQIADQKYEGQIDQLVWDCQASGFQYMMNKYRPFGSFTAVSASEVVVTLMGKYAPDIDLTFVQSKLAFVTLTFDGTKTMSEVLDIIAKAIGGGRWYLDGRALHFFNPPAPSTIVIPAGSTGTGADFTAPVLTLGSSMSSTAKYAKAYYAVRVTFRYSNGTESRLGPTSNAVASDGGHYLAVSSIPVGLNPGGGITCIGRNLYFLQGSNALAFGVELDDNVTTSLSFAPLSTVPPSAGTNKIGSTVTVTDSNSTDGATQQALTFSPATFHPSPFYYTGTDFGMFFVFGSTPKFNYINNKADLRGGFLIQIAPSDSVGISARSYAYWVQFAINLVYPDGSTSALSEWAEQGLNPFQGFFLGNITSGTPGQLPTFTCFYIPGAVSAPLVNGKKPYQINLFMKVVGKRGFSIGGGANDESVDPIVQQIGSVPYYDAVSDSGPTNGGAALDTSTVVDQSPIDFGSQPKPVPGTTDQTYVWPNPDGPYLEDSPAPHDIDDDDTDLLHEDSGSQPFVSTEDITQLRNLVKVYGAASVLVTDAAVGDNAVAIANADVFPLGGGKVVAANGVELSFFSVSSQIDSTNTPAKLLLTAPLTAAIPNGTVVSFYCVAEDKAAQKKRGLIEVDSLGRPTDGVHEFVIRDQSLNTTQAVYLRANAELSIFKDPIITIKYATRDPLTKPGKRVTVNLTNPPCQGTFLIQSVDIDQIRDEGDQLAPRYTVVASSVFYDLTNFLLLLTADSQIAGAGSQSSQGGGGSSQVGVIGAAAQQALASSTGAALDPEAMSNMIGYHSYGVSAAGTTAMTGIIGAGSWGFSGNNATTAVIDDVGFWIRGTSTATGNSNSLTQQAAIFRANYNPRMKLHIRLSSNPTNQRWWIGWKVSSAPIFPNADTITGTGAGYGLRYSTVAGDTGWTLWTTDSTTFTLDTHPITQAPLALNTEYEIEVVTYGNGAYFTATVNGNTSPAMAIPQFVLRRDLLFACNQFQTIAGVTVQYDVLRAYLGRDGS